MKGARLSSQPKRPARSQPSRRILSSRYPPAPDAVGAVEPDGPGGAEGVAAAIGIDDSAGGATVNIGVGELFGGQLDVHGPAAVAALAAALVLSPIVDASSEGSTLAVATNLAYPIADLALLTLVVTAAAFTGWRPGRSWTILGAGLLLLAVSDVTYLLQSAEGTYVEGTILDVGWPLGILLLATAAWVEPGESATRQSRAARLIALPAAAALIAIGIQAADRFTSIPAAASAISLVTLVAVVVRLVLSLRETQGNLLVSERDSRTDALTGLPNRRALMNDLEEAIRHPPPRGSLRLLAMFDLDGFKLYNDTFGHPAGDALLTRLGARLENFSAHKGHAYRLDG